MIDRQLDGCQVMLVMIGAKWHSIADGHGRVRLHNRHDFVRYEVETALRRKIRLVPVLIDDTPTPLEEHLPETLHPLLRRQALELDFRRHTEAALNRLVDISRKALSMSTAPPPVSQPTWSEFKVGDVVQRMRWIEPGTFWMGSPDDEPERYPDETQHRVTPTRGYWIADTACTQALWQEVIGSNPSRFKDDLQNPVEGVSWNDVTGLFLPKLNERVPGLNLVLPTEAQWENACRAGTETPFSFGRQITSDQVNLRELPKEDGAGEGAACESMGAVPDARERVGMVRRRVWGLSAGRRESPSC